MEAFEAHRELLRVTLEATGKCSDGVTTMNWWTFDADCAGESTEKYFPKEVNEGGTCGKFPLRGHEGVQVWWLARMRYPYAGTSYLSA